MTAEQKMGRREGMEELTLKMRAKYPDETDKTEGRSDDLIKVLDEAVEKKYQKIKENREGIHRNTGVLSAVEMDKSADCRVCQKENDGSGDSQWGSEVREELWRNDRESKKH